MSHNSNFCKTSLSLSSSLCHLPNPWDDLRHTWLRIVQEDFGFPSSLPGTCGNLAQLDDLWEIFLIQGGDSETPKGCRSNQAEKRGSVWERFSQPHDGNCPCPFCPVRVRDPKMGEKPPPVQLPGIFCRNATGNLSCTAR